MQQAAKSTATVRFVEQDDHLVCEVEFTDGRNGQAKLPFGPPEGSSSPLIFINFYADAMRQAMLDAYREL